MANKLERYLDNLKEEALKQVIRALMNGEKEIIMNQIDEFNKMFTEKGV